MSMIDQSVVNMSDGATERPAVLVTGGSGVVGTALLRRLRGVEVVCLVHRSPVIAPHARTVRGDISAQRFGLTERAYAELAARIGAVIHCAAVTDFNRTDGTLQATNVGGTQNVVEFAEAADATLYHLSSAFADTTADGERGHTAASYASSKSLGEELVRTAGVPHVILRPSVVIGDAETGEIAAFQGLHHVVAGIFAGLVPMIPFDPSWPIDFLPCDVVADAVGCVVENGVADGEFWITAGEQALRLDEGVEICVELARGLGVAVDLPRFVPPETFNRLIGPVFLEAMPARIRRSVAGMLEFFTTYLRSGATKPSSLPALAVLGMQPPPDQRESLRTSLLYWARAKGYAGTEATKVT